MSKQLQDQLTNQLTKAIAGKDLLLSLWDSEGQKLLAIAGQQGLTINRDKDTIEITSKDAAGGWKQFLTGLKEWSIDNDGVFVRDDDTHKTLKRAYDTGDPLLIKVTNNKTKEDMFGGLVLVTSYPLEAPYDDAVTYSVSLQGTGELVDLGEDEEEEEEQTEQNEQTDPEA